MKHLLLVPWIAGLLMGLPELSAQSMTHATIEYVCLGNQQYRFTLTLNRDCRDTTPFPTMAPIQITGLGNCTTTTFTHQLARQARSPWQSLGGVCPHVAGYACTPGATYYNFNQRSYVDTIDLSVFAGNCGWKASFQACCRTLGSSQINNSSSSDFYTEVISLMPSCNSSPRSARPMVWTFCDQDTQHIDLRIHDPDGDSLVYALVAPLTAAGQSVTYAAGLSASSPLTTSNGFQLTSQGVLTFIPNGTQESAVDVLLSEYRAGSLIGQTRRTIHLVAFPCTATNRPPMVTNFSYNAVGFTSTNLYNNGASTVLQLPIGNSNFLGSVVLYDPDGDTILFNSATTNFDQIFGPNNWASFLNSNPPFRPDSVQLFIQINFPQVSMFSSLPIDCYLFTIGVTDAGCPNHNVVPIDFTYDHLVCAEVEGQILLDDNYNCQLDPHEQQPIYQGRVRFEDTTTHRIAEVPVNAAGKYSIHSLDTGVYWVSYLPRTASYLACPPMLWHHRTPFMSDTLNLSAQLVDSCVSLRVGIGAPVLRHCFQNYYQVTYCNDGPVTVADAYIDVWLDSFFVVDSTTHPIDSQSGNFYRFALDTLFGGQGFCDAFRIYGKVDTSCNPILLGRTLCAEAHIHPDTACRPWQGAVLEVEGQCINGLPNFRIHNIGTAAMQQPTSYRTYQDNFVYSTSSPIQLAAGASTPWVTYSVNPSSTYRVEIPQDSSYSGAVYASATLDNCANVIWIHGGWVNQFPLMDQEPQRSIDCQPALGAYDPNDKQGFPTGYGPTHVIERSTDLEYRIRFQNTGTFFAQDVVVLDTLSPHLDAFSVQPQVSSHAYTWRLIDQHILEFTFNNIMLPDSGRDQLGSIGFIDYRVQQQPNLPLGTRIENQAAIYFDLNPPIFTNTTWHTVDENFVLVISVPVLEQEINNVAVTALPNPFRDIVLLRVEREQPYPSLELELYNAMGQLVRRQTQAGTRELYLERNNLPSGIYFYRLSANDQLLHSGKLIAQ